MFIKTIQLYVLLFGFVLILSGCSQNNDTYSKKADNQKKLTIVTSFYPMYISTINVTKDISNVEVINMTKPQTGCLHDYQLAPKDLITLDGADLFIINGVGMEAFIEDVINKQKNLKIIEASKGIELIKDENGEENPHVWVSITNAIKQVRNIADELCLFDTENASKYKSNANTYIAKLEQLKLKMNKGLTDISSRDMITFHEAFPYFAKEFNLNIVAVIEREPGTAPTPKELEETIEIVKASKTKALFAEPQYEGKAAETIAKETKAKVYYLDPIVTGEATKNSMDDYISKMENNLKVLQEGLK